MEFIPIDRIGALVAGEGAGPYRKHGLRRKLYAMMLLGDAIAVILGFTVAGWARFGGPFETQVLLTVGVTVPIFLIFSAATLSADALADWKHGLPRVMMSLLGAMAVVLFVGFYLKTSTGVSRLMMSVGFVASAALIAGGRLLIGRVARRTFGHEVVSELLIVDHLEFRAPSGTHWLKSDLVGLADDLSGPFTLDRLAQCIEGFDSVAVACPPDRREAWAVALRATNVRAYLVLPELGISAP